MLKLLAASTDIWKRKTKYKEQVDSYTTELIGAKISPNTPKFEAAQIQNSDLVLKNPAMLRVVTKWIEELEGYFKEDSILKREHPFKMMDGCEEYLKRD